MSIPRALLLCLLLALPGCGTDREPASAPQTAGAADLSPEQQQLKERLESLGYAAATEPAPEARGVILARSDETAGGFTLFTSGHAPMAALVDMRGEPVHTWQLPFERAWPEAGRPERFEDSERWRYAHMLPSGDLLAIFEGLGLIRIDRRSNLLWAADIRAHHDLDVLPDGDIWVLTREAHLVPRIDPERPVLEDFVTRLDPEGRVLESISLLEAFERSDLDPAVQRRFRPTGDLFHTNTLQVLDGSLADLSPRFARGNILTAFNRLSVIAILDPVARRFVWAMAGPWQGVHYPTLLDDGRILLFANGARRGASAALLFDVRRGEYDWTYRGSPPESLFSEACGSAQMLPDGNVLIAESADGRILEVTPDGEIVWEYLNTFEMPGASGKIPLIYFATRFDSLPDFLRSPG